MDALGCAFLPASCALCGSPLPHLSYAPIYAACSSETPVDSNCPCAGCGDTLDVPAPVVSSAAKSLGRTCRLTPSDFVRVVSFGPYRGQMREAVHLLEYDGLTAATCDSAQMLASAIATLAPETPREMLVVPMPLQRSKCTARGFKQARALAVEVLALLHKTDPDWCLSLAPSTLKLQRAVSSQSGLSPQRRRLNVGGAFRVSDLATVAGKHILVVGDILATGTSARATARALLQAGAETVWLATLARRTGATADNAFKAADDQPEIGAVPDFRARQASMYSQNQPSF